MQTLKKLHLLHLLLLTSQFSLPISIAKQTPSPFCGKIRIQSPFLPTNSSDSSILNLNYMVLCKSHKLYFRSSLGLLPISSIDYKNKLLTISHNSSFLSSHFVSPSHLSAGFPPPPLPNSLILFNCSKMSSNSVSHFLHNCSVLQGNNSRKVVYFSKFSGQESNKAGVSSCLLVEDIAKLEVDFHPKDLNCSSYRPVYRTAASVDNENIQEFELGTRISFDIPDHVPNPCDQCQKPYGNCGAGLRCICHPKECKDKVISLGIKMKPFGNLIFSFLAFVVVMY